MTLLRNRADLARTARLSEVRWTHLQYLLESPAHYLDSFDDAANEDSSAKRIGRTVDAYVLGGEQPVIYQGKRQGDAWERFRRFHAGHDILTVAENDAAKYAADAIESNRDAMAVLEHGTAHPEIVWRWADSRPCVSHPDYVARDWITEIKVCNTAHPTWFMAYARRAGYPIQLAMYDAAVMSTGDPDDLPLDDHFIVAASYKRPFVSTVFRLRGIDAAHWRLVELFKLLAHCEKTDDWRGYTNGAVDFPVDGAVADVAVEQIG